MNIEHGEKQSSVRNKEMASKSPDFEALRAASRGSAPAAPPTAEEI